MCYNSSVVDSNSRLMRSLVVFALRNKAWIVSCALESRDTSSFHIVPVDLLSSTWKLRALLVIINAEIAKKATNREVTVPLIGVQDGRLTEEDTNFGHRCHPLSKEAVLVLSEKRKWSTLASEPGKHVLQISFKISLSDDEHVP